MKQDIVPLKFELVERPLDSLLTALANKIEREWPQRFHGVEGARELFLIMTKTANVTYRTVRWICADKPRDVFRRPEYSISVAPLNRTIMDSIFTVIFLVEDLSQRCPWYFKAGWREAKLELQRHLAEYGALPDWQDWLKRFSDYCDQGISEFQIPAPDVADPERIERWPNPGQMVMYGVKKGATLSADRQFLRYLNDWFYKDLSSQSHLGGFGLMKRGGFLLTYRPHEEDHVAQLTKFKHQQVGMTLTLVLVLASEIEAFFKFGLDERAKYVWTVLLNSIPLSKELYEKRQYATLLMPSAA